jgi:hypothetical protein
MLPSGGPQISDIMIVVLTLLLLPKFITTIVKNETAKAMTVFIFYVIIVNLFWSLFYLDSGIAKNILFFVFNGSVFLIVMSQANRERFWKVTLYAVVASLFMQFALLPIGRLFAGFRPIIFFNNPNQLGYWALLVTCLLWLVNRKLKLNQYLYIGLLLFTLFFVFLSLSRAGMASATLVAVFTLFVNSLKKTVIILIILIPIGIANYQSVISNLEFVEKIEHRLEHSGNSDNAEGRGYDRIWNHPGYLFLGAGEGRYGRFRSGYLGEMHSSLGTLLFCYGVVGCFLLGLFIFMVVRNNQFTEYFILIPLAIYSLTHMGLRFSYFWIVLAFLAAYTIPYTVKDKAFN